MQNMAVDEKNREESLSGFRKRLEAREFRYPLPYALTLPKNSRSTENTLRYIVFSHTVHHSTSHYHL